MVINPAHASRCRRRRRRRLLLLLLLQGDNTSSDVTMTQRPFSAGR